jgi:hypothetical protein
MGRILAIGTLSLGAVGAGELAAQERYTFTATFAGGLAGVVDGEGSREFEHPALQAAFGMFTGDRTLTMVRVGRVGFDEAQVVAGVADAELQYANVAGEHRFRQPAYDFGIYLGVGSYRVAGEAIAGDDESTALGVVLGFTGEFDVTRRLSLVAEVDAHYVFFDDEEIYGAGLVGLAVHF